MPGTDSPVVARMRAAGAIILGKTNVPILSASGTHANNSWAGPTLNAAAPDLVPGASSSGTATAVCASMAVLGLAEETGGSIQNPASAQGLVGIKPSFALVPNAGVMPLASQRDVVGPIGRCVRDAALALDVLAGFTMEDPKTVAGVGNIPEGGYASLLSETALAGTRLGLYGPGWRDQGLTPETAALYARAQGEIAARGATLVADPFLGSGFAALRRPVSAEYQFDARGLESARRTTCRDTWSAWAPPPRSAASPISPRRPGRRMPSGRAACCTTCTCCRGFDAALADPSARRRWRNSSRCAPSTAASSTG